MIQISLRWIEPDLESHMRRSTDESSIRAFSSFYQGGGRRTPRDYAALWEGRRAKHNTFAARMWVRMHATHLAGFLRGHSTRVCVWVIKESDCHIRRPTRKGCGLCPSLSLCPPTLSFCPSVCWPALAQPRHSFLLPTRRGLVFEAFFAMQFSGFRRLRWRLTLPDETRSVRDSLGSQASCLGLKMLLVDDRNVLYGS